MDKIKVDEQGRQAELKALCSALGEAAAHGAECVARALLACSVWQSASASEVAEAVELCAQKESLRMSEHGAPSRVLSLVIDGKADWARGSLGSVGLLVAVRFGHLEGARAMVSKGWSIDQQVGKHARRALEVAVEQGRADMARLLMESGADPKAHAPEGPLLCMAALRGDVEMAKALLEGGADIRDGGPGGMTPLHVAASAGRSSMARFLIEQGAPLNLLDEDGLDPMGWAIDERQEGAAIELARLGADLSTVYILGGLELGAVEWARKKGLLGLVEVMEARKERAALSEACKAGKDEKSPRPRI